MTTGGRWLIGAVLAVLAASPATATKIDPNTLQWDVHILIDQSRTVFPESFPQTLPGQHFSPRDNRGLAISPDGRYLYAGYNNSFLRDDDGNPIQNRQGEVRIIDLTKSGMEDPFVGRVLGNRGKAIGVDDMGRVYMAEGNRIDVYSPDLLTKHFTLGSLNQTEGVALAREGGNLYLYSSDRSTGRLTKWQVNEAGPGIAAITIDASFGTGGFIALPGANSLRGVEVDGAGNVWVAGFGSNLLYRVSPTGTTIQFAAIANPFDIAFNGDQVLITHHTSPGFIPAPTDRTISLFEISDFEANAISAGAVSLVPPWGDLFLSPWGNFEAGFTGALSGIVMVPGLGFFVTNEAGQTADQKSRYGVTDQNSGFGDDGVFYQDVFYDDNDPILFARLAALPPPFVIPEPTSIVFSLLALAALALYARRLHA